MTSLPAKLRFSSALEPYFLALLATVSFLSLTAVAALSLGVFTKGVMLVAAALSAAAGFRFFRKSKSQQTLKAFDWLLITIVLFSLLMRSNPASYLHGGQDPGVYNNLASYFANHGTSWVKDPLLVELSDNPELKHYYTQTFYRPVVTLENGKHSGNIMPGLYLRDLEKGIWAAQFYYLSPLWLAMGNWLLGFEYQGWMLVFFSAFTVLCCGLITRRVTGSGIAGLAAAFLLAVNPAHSYMATFPVSETVACFFFLAALYALLERHFLLTGLLCLCLFLTRITGFVALPFLLAALFWGIIKRKDQRYAWLGLFLIAAYALSYYWGLVFSPSYSADIYRGKLGISPSLLWRMWLLFPALGAAWCVLSFGLLKTRLKLDTVVRFLMRYSRQIAFLTVLAVILIVAFKGYRLAFTEHYANHRWFMRRWNMAGRGTESLQHLSLFILNLMLSPAGFLAFLGGLIIAIKRSFSNSRMAFISVLCVGFLGALTIKQFTVPYLYYYGRYLVSELVPLSVICQGIFLAWFIRKYPRARITGPVVFCLVVSAFFLPANRGRLSFREGDEFTQALKCAAQITDSKCIILVDKNQFAESPILTPLRLTFDKMVFGMRVPDYQTDDRLKNLFKYFQDKGFKVYLMSSQVYWEGRAGLKRKIRIPFIVRSIGGRGKLPDRVRTKSYPTRLYSLSDTSPLPSVCQKVLSFEG